MIFEGGNKFHWGNSTEWSTGCVVAAGPNDISTKTNYAGWLSFDLTSSKDACYAVTEYFGGQKGDQNYKFWHPDKKKVVIRPAIKWNGKKPKCIWEIR